MTLTNDPIERHKAAAKLISDWGCEGVESAARLVGNETAQGMLQSHVRKNVQQSHPGLEVRGDETTEELKQKVENHRKKTVESQLSPKERKAVKKAKATLRKHCSF